MIYVGMDNLQVEVLYDFLTQMTEKGYRLEFKEDQDALEKIIKALKRYLDYMNEEISDDEKKELEEKFGGEK
ncbi:MAG: hypothetical protein M1542_07525 [Thermotogae bacterium]|nr:hypothetical protein [Thermotogota bacterium]MCL5033074.1 hypothetical protein [Thermotogota bacterium]